MRVIPFDALVPAPWRNGGGVTREIARGSDGRGLRWRLSLAEIARDGPFSPFPGLDRVLTVVAGEGFVLVLPGGPHPLERLSPFAFGGGVPVAARLSAGPVRVLNAMSRAGEAAASVRVFRGGARWLIPDDPAATVAVHVVADGATLDGAAVRAGDTVLGAAGLLELRAGAEAVAVTLAG